MSFLGGKNTGGDRVDYYDNPNFNPKDEGKSKGDKLLRKAAAEQNYSDKVETDYVEGRSDDYHHLVQTEGEAAYAQSKADDQVKATVSYFRGIEKERLNPGGVGGPQINPKFSEPTSLYAKLSKMEYKKDSPMDKTVAGVNQDLQARKARTRDFAMEFRGTVYDYIDEVAKSVRDDIAIEVAEGNKGYVHPFDYEQQLSKKQLEDKFFPDEESKKAAKTELKRMIAFTDEIGDIPRNYSGVHEYAETILRTEYYNAPFPLGVVDPQTDKGVDDKLTSKNYEKSKKAFSDWKAKKGVPKIVRLISKLG